MPAFWLDVSTPVGVPAISCGRILSPAADHTHWCVKSFVRWSHATDRTWTQTALPSIGMRMQIIVGTILTSNQVWYDTILVKVSLRKCRGKGPTHSQRLQVCPVCVLGRFALEAYCWDTEIPLWVCVLLASPYPSNPWFMYTQHDRSFTLLSDIIINKSTSNIQKIGPTVTLTANRSDVPKNWSLLTCNQQEWSDYKGCHDTRRMLTRQDNKWIQTSDNRQQQTEPERSSDHLPYQVGAISKVCLLICSLQTLPFMMIVHASINHSCIFP